MFALLLPCALILGFGGWLASGASAAGVAVPEYQIGDRATVDVVTPLPLVVVDSSRTDEMRRQALQRVPPVFFYCTNAVEAAQSGFHLAFNQVQTEFMAALERTFNGRALNPDALAGDKFQRFIGSFQKLHRSFPLETNLAQTWARGETGESFRIDWGLKLRAATSSYLRPDLWPEGARPGPAHVLLLAVPSTNARVTMTALEQSGALVHRTNLVTVSKARRELANELPPADAAIAAFLAGFIEPNCYFSESLTEACRTKRIGPILVAKEFRPGQLVVKAGERVDERQKAALDQLRSRLAATEARPDAGSAQEQLAAMSRLTRWLLAATLVLTFIVALALWQFARARRAGSLLPVRFGELDGPPSPGTQFWQKRALAAEQRAEQAAHLVKSGLLPQLGRWLSDKFVRGLVTQRSEMLDIQRQAAKDLEELEARLGRMQAPVADRLAAYEQRIAELERQLAIESAKNRTLLEVKVGMIRQRLAAVRTRQRAGFN